MRIAIFGLGSIGTRHMLNLLDMGETDIMAYDPRIGEAGFSCAPIQGTNSLDLVWQWQPEAVLICTPPDIHRELTLEAFYHGAHVFCEKPLAQTYDEAATLHDVSISCRRILAIGYQLRWQLSEFCREANGRDIQFVSAQDMARWPSQYPKDILEEFSHEIDAACWINGPVEAVAARTTGQCWRLDLRHLRCVSTISIKADAVTPERFAARIDGKAVWQFNQEQNDQAYKTEVQAFLEVCNGAAWDDHLCTGIEAAHVVEIIKAAKESARTCKVVKL